MKTRKLLLNLLTLLVFASLLAACGGAAATEAPAATEPAADGDLAALYEAAKAEGMLTTIALPLDWCNNGAMY